MDQYGTMAQAIFELVDNPIDYRRGRHMEVDVEVDRRQDLIVVQDVGGEGMDAEGIADWLNWGSGHPHAASDIGRFHVGGKAAAGSLGNSIRIWARRADTNEIWFFEDKEWATRPDWKQFGEPQQAKQSDLPRPLQSLPDRVGFVRIEITDLRPTRRYRPEDLKFQLANTYRALLEKGQLTIRVDAVPVEPLALPESSAFQHIEVDEHLPCGRRLRGRIWRLNRDELVESSRLIRGGIRCLYNGRLIREGEYFGHNLEGKGLLASLIGEIELGFVKTVPNKTDFHRDSPQWEQVEEQMNQILAPIVASLRRAQGERQISREERKRANQVRSELSEALKRINFDGASSNSAHAGDDGELEPGVGGRRSPRLGRNGSNSGHGSGSGTHTPRTEPPPNAVGTLQRLLRRSRGGDFPPIRLKPLDPTLRSGSGKDDDDSECIIVNIDHFMYKESEKSECYIAETAILPFLRPSDDETDYMTVEQYYGATLQLLNAWYEVHDMGGG
jgi:hypothetical protein